MNRLLSVALLTCLTVTPYFFGPNLGTAHALNRPSDPVVMDGSQIADLTGLSPSTVVAFRWRSGWTQIPVQIDERFANDYGIVYNTTPLGFANLAYADAGTFMGADPDPTFDNDDELVFMAKDAGDKASWIAPDPNGVVAGTRTQILITDPLTFEEGYVYLFQTDGSLTPDAEADYVTYNFNLLSGPYLTTYNTQTGPNPEDSQITTAYYRNHFGDRWIRDEINIYAGSATGVDVLDRHKSLFAPGICTRSENTFSNGEGAFFVNKDGPVRAIRSYMGANSGPLTQRDHFYYERRHDVHTYLRVHLIPGVMDFYDYSPAASGLSYYNDFNTGGVTIDGDPVETPTSGQITWEMVTGAQGTLIFGHTLTTDITGFSYNSYYLDDSTPSTTQCTGDNFAYGSSGIWIAQFIPNTDPVSSPFNHLVSVRVAYMEAPNQTVTTAEARRDQAANPLVGSVLLPTAVGEPPMVPGYRLSQNYPNPFTTHTQIDFVVPRRERATIQVFDIAGRLVKSLSLPSSSGTAAFVTWDGTDLKGQAVASGIYFYRLETPRFTQTRKMVLIQ